METDATKYMSIKLERSLSTLGELGLDDVVRALGWNGVEKVRLVPFGLLGLFPFPAVQVQSIHGGKKRLGDLFEVTIAPSARAIEVAEKRAANLDRVTRPYLLLGGGVRGLPYTQAEADTARKIAERFGYGEKNIHYLRSAGVTKEKVVEVLKHAWYAHLAVHGVYQPDNPRRSHLLLADKEDVREEHCIFLSEALERTTADGRDTLNLEGVRLLVLSACETAIIDVRQVPDEVIGLAAGFLQAGAAGVIASLWAVDDRATYLLMSRFAQLYLDPQRTWSPARALAEAQRWLCEEATNKVLMTYDPVEGVGAGKAFIQAQKGESVPANSEGEFAVSRLRSLRYSHNAGLAEVHLAATMRALQEPDALPYADPAYWAAFVVTGC
jgi:CHAT domain-containing protein